MSKSLSPSQQREEEAVCWRIKEPARTHNGCRTSRGLNVTCVCCVNSSLSDFWRRGNKKCLRDKPSRADLTLSHHFHSCRRPTEASLFYCLLSVTSRQVVCPSTLTHVHTRRRHHPDFTAGCRPCDLLHTPLNPLITTTPSLEKPWHCLHA